MLCVSGVPEGEVNIGILSEVYTGWRVELAKVTYVFFFLNIFFKMRKKIN